MDKITGVIQEKVGPFASKFSSQKHLASIRDGMAMLTPLTIIGGLAMLLASPPIPETLKNTNFFTNLLFSWASWAEKFHDILMTPYNLTLGVISIYVALAISYYLSKEYEMNPLSNAVISVFMLLLVAAPSVNFEDGQFLMQADLGAQGMFAAIVISIAIVEINRFFINHKLVIKMPASVPPGVAAPFEALIPVFFSTIFFLLMNQVSIHFTRVRLSGIIYLLLKPLADVSGSLPIILLLASLSLILWFFGIHGENMIGAIITPITTMNIALNLEQYQAGKEMTHIFSGAFYAVWGPWLAYPALVLSIILVSKSTQLKTLGKLASVGSLFNINEPLVFGVPTVLNPMTLIPSLITINMNIIVVYLATSLNLIGKIYMFVPWTAPGILQVFLSTMDWKTIILWLILFVINTVIWIPFIKSYDNQLCVEETKVNASKENTQ